MLMKKMQYVLLFMLAVSTAAAAESTALPDFLPLRRAIAGGDADYIVSIINRDYHGSLKNVKMGAVIFAPNEKIASLLIQYGADVQENAYPNGLNLLIFACVGGNLDMVKFALDHNLPVNSKDTQGRSPLAWCIVSQNLEIAKLLIEKGADINSQDSAGRTILTMATITGKLNFVAFLLDHGADPGILDSTGKLASDYAQMAPPAPVTKETYQAIEKLLTAAMQSRGEDPAAIEHNSGLPLDPKDPLNAPPPSPPSTSTSSPTPAQP